MCLVSFIVLIEDEVVILDKKNKVFIVMESFVRNKTHSKHKRPLPGRELCKKLYKMMGKSDYFSLGG